MIPFSPDEDKRTRQDRIERVKQYERLFEEAAACPDEAKLRQLEAYYASGEWLEDYTADENGEFPPDLKRGVLSQDALFDFLEQHGAAGETEENHMALDDRTLGSLLSEPSIRPIARDAIRNRDLSREELWHKTLKQIREEHCLAGDIGRGLERLYAAAGTDDWYHPLYSEAECLEDEARRGVSLVWLPSGEAAADERPFILLVPGGGFVNVWNITEGWPIAERFNRLGYHVFVLTYQVDGDANLLEKNMEDFARALRLIRENETRFRVRGDRYITCGFSAGGYLVCLWNTRELGYAARQLPGPQAVFPVYPFVSPKLDTAGDRPEEDTEEDRKEDIRLYGCSVWEAVNRCYEIPEHAEGFPPCALFLAADDGLVDPKHSVTLAGALEALHIPCRLEVGPAGGHGFGDGTGMCMEGWPERAAAWYENL